MLSGNCVIEQMILLAFLLLLAALLFVVEGRQSLLVEVVHGGAHQVGRVLTVKICTWRGVVVAATLLLNGLQQSTRAAGAPMLRRLVIPRSSVRRIVIEVVVLGGG